MKAQPDHYYAPWAWKSGTYGEIWRCRRCHIWRRPRGIQGQVPPWRSPGPEWSMDGGKTWSTKHTACPFKKTYPMEKPMTEERLGPSDDDAVAKEMAEGREGLFKGINEKLRDATVIEVVEYEFGPSDDPEITCIICGEDKCDLESVAYQTTKRGRHGRVAVGKHSQCRRKSVPVPR